MQFGSMKVVLTEQDIFANIAECTTRDFPTLSLKIEELYDYKLSDLEKSDIRATLSKFNLYKKKKFGKHAADYDSLVEMGSTTKCLLMKYQTMRSQKLAKMSRKP